MQVVKKGKRATDDMLRYVNEGLLLEYLECIPGIPERR